MAVLGPSDDEGRLRTFRAPPTMPVPVAQRHRALERLLVAATEADAAQSALADARARYLRAPSPENTSRILNAAAEALQKEVRFDELWEEVSREWFGPRPAAQEDAIGPA